MDKLNFTGKQNMNKSEVNISGYFQILPKQDEFRVPIRAYMVIHDKKNLSHDFVGSITQLILGIPPEITLYSKGVSGGQLFYRFENYEFVPYYGKNASEKLICSGIWCPVNKETASILALPYGTPKISKKASLEFVLSTDEEKLLIKKIRFSE